MRFFYLVLLCAPLLLSGCFPQKNGVVVTNAYMVETPKTFPAAAIFMTLENHTGQRDRMIDFKTDRAGRVELHTMALENNIMRMRQVSHYDVMAGGKHELKHMADHIMLFDMQSDFVVGETFNGVVLFEKAGEIPVTIYVKPRRSK